MGWFCPIGCIQAVLEILDYHCRGAGDVVRFVPRNLDLKLLPIVGISFVHICTQISTILKYQQILCKSFLHWFCPFMLCVPLSDRSQDIRLSMLGERGRHHQSLTIDSIPLCYVCGSFFDCFQRYVYPRSKVIGT